MSSPGQRLKEIRKKLGLTQAQFGDKIGLKWHKIKDMERDHLKISPELAEKIEQVLSISGWWLLTGKGEMFLSDEPKLIGINNSIVGQAGHNINGTVHIQTLTNNSSAPKTPNDEKNIQELIETFKQLPPELQDYYLNLMKAELSKYKYEQKKLSQG